MKWSSRKLLDTHPDVSVHEIRMWEDARDSNPLLGSSDFYGFVLGLRYGLEEAAERNPIDSRTRHSNAFGSWLEEPA